MNLSQGEYQALVAKALRGVGYPWGHTEDGAFAVRWLESVGIATVDIVLGLLSYVDSAGLAAMVPNADWTAGDALCPLSVGTSIADHLGCEDLQLGPTVEPLLIAPFVSSTLGSGEDGQYELRWGANRCVVSAEILTLAGDLPKGPVPVAIVRHKGHRQQFDLPGLAKPSRVEVSEANLARLQQFAHRVYAPATAESRLSGAGAGLIDD